MESGNIIPSSAIILVHIYDVVLFCSLLTEVNYLHRFENVTSFTMLTPRVDISEDSTILKSVQIVVFLLLVEVLDITEQSGLATDCEPQRVRGPSPAIIEGPLYERGNSAQELQFIGCQYRGTSLIRNTPLPYDPVRPQCSIVWVYSHAK